MFEFVDKLVWMVIMLYVREIGGRMVFFDYDIIVVKINVFLIFIVFWVIVILCLMCWLMLCVRV